MGLSCMCDAVMCISLNNTTYQWHVQSSAILSKLFTQEIANFMDFTEARS